MAAMAEGAAPSLPDLIQSLDQASLMAKQLSSTSNPTHLHQIHNSLNKANLNLSAFLCSAAVNCGRNEPMQVENSKGGIEVVEEKMKDCFVVNKRVKRSLSPSAAAEERRGSCDRRFGSTEKGFDPRVERLRALDLISRFHA